MRLLGTPAEGRDRAWRDGFYAAVAGASVAAADPPTLVGPDDFPYGSVRLPNAGETYTATSITHLLTWATDNGCGAVLHDAQGQMVWVFTYGNLWSLRIRGTLDASPPDDDQRPETLTAPEQVLVGQPTEDTLPPWARTVLRGHLAAAGVTGARVALVARAAGNPHWSLALDLPADDAAAHRVTWFLPPDYGLLPSSALDASQLAPL